MAKKFLPTQEQLLQITDLRKQYHNNQEIADITGITLHRIYVILKEHNLFNDKKRRTKELAPRIIEMFMGGMSAYAIDKIIDLDKKTIVKILNDNGFVLTPVKKHHTLDADVIELRMSGFKRCEIAAKLKVHETTVGAVFKKYKLRNIDKFEPLRKTCIDCPENGPQSIENFNRRRIQATGKEFIKRRCKNCERTPKLKLREMVSRTIRMALKNNGVTKNGESCLDYLDFTIEELRAHLERLFEPWMNWKNYGSYYAAKWDDNDPTTWRWNIDHIIPQSDLPYNAMTDENFRLCWALSNLRPYSAKQNLVDGFTFIRHKRAA